MAFPVVTPRSCTTSAHLSSFLWETSTESTIVILSRQTQQFIGMCGYNNRTIPSLGVYEIGYWCDVAQQGKGYVTEAVNAVSRYALAQLQAKMIVIRMATDNTKSIAVAERLKFAKHQAKASVAKNGAMDYYYICESQEYLPALEIFCSH